MIQDKFRDPHKGWLSEIFSSVQGEGVYCGLRQLFIRFAGCNLNCSFCDAREAIHIPKTYGLEKVPGTLEKTEYPNPVSPEKLVEIIKPFRKYHHHSIAMTGGEPLLQHEFLKIFMPMARELGFAFYLETNGTLYRELQEVIRNVDYVAMDFKLPSVIKGKECWEEHRRFLRIAHRSRVYVKIVISPEADPKEVEEAAAITAEVSKSIPFIIQPMSRADGSFEFDMKGLMEVQSFLSKTLDDVRIVPQVHKFLKVL